jgi:hypothetical protein
MLPHDPVDPLDPAAAVPGEAFGFRRADVLLRVRRGEEPVVEVDGGMAAGEEDLRRDGGGEPDAQG